MMVTIQELQKSYDKKLVLRIDHLDLNKGEVVGLVGNNGAGKTTLFSLILDLIPADKGQVKLKDTLINKDESWKKYTGAYINEDFIADFLTPEEYFDFVGELYQWNKSEVEHFLHQFETLFNGEILNQNKYIRDLSKGNQKKVGIVGALVGNPELIILDEPFSNLDPSSQMRLKQLIDNLTFSDKTVLISSHDLGHVTDVCTRIIILENGLIVKDLQKTAETLDELESYFLSQ